MQFLVIQPHETYEDSVRRNILALTAQGRAKEALEDYVSAFQLGAITSARTHHAAFVAAREVEKGLFALFLIEDEAESCEDFEGEVELNFDRDWAVYDAEVASESDLTDALQGINDVIRRRTEAEGLDSPQLQVDKLALGKILLMGGKTDDALDVLNELVLHGPRLDQQTKYNAEWWRFVATMVAKDYSRGRQLAYLSLEGGDPKPTRRAAWWITGIPLIGSSVARFRIVKKLKL